MSDPKRILMLLENNSFADDQRPQAEARSLINHGFQVTVICPMRRGGKFHECLYGASLYQFPSLPHWPSVTGYICEYLYSAMMMYLLSAFVFLREGFDVLHVHNPPDVFFVLMRFYKRLGKKCVFDHHDLWSDLYRVRTQCDEKNFTFRVILGCEKASLKSADWVLTTNESYKQVAINRANLSPSRITIVRNGPRLEDFIDLDAIPAQELATKTLIGYLGRIGPQDGVDFLLRAMHHLVKDLGRENVLCVLIGNGDALEGLRHQTADLELSGHIDFRGWMQHREALRLLKMTQMCAAPEPSNQYNDRSTIVKLMEYMALGKATVAFDLPEHRITLQDAGLYARANCEMDFARKLAELIDNPGRCRQLGMHGLKRISKDLCWSKQEVHLLRAYESIIADVAGHKKCSASSRIERSRVCAREK